MAKTRTTHYDVAEHLRTPEEMAAYLEACLEEAKGDVMGFIDAGMDLDPTEISIMLDIMDWNDADIVIEAGPVVLAGGFQPVEQFGRGGALVRFQPRTATKVDQRVRFFGTGRDHTARTVVFETAADQHLVVGEQRCGQRIAQKPAQAFAVEGKVNCLGAVNQTATLRQTSAHRTPPFASNPGQSGRLALILSCRSAGGAEDCAG